MEILARVSFLAAFGPASVRFGGSGCHKILKSDPAALSKAGVRWYIPPATPKALPRVAFSGSLRIGTARPARWPIPFRHPVFDKARNGLSRGGAAR